MKLNEFQLLTDENINPDLVEYLRKHGFNVLDIKESGRQGATIQKSFDLAIKQNE
ncbi:MAG: DUF5615 family PIN-like protein [Lewinellaceae bacterium]|nr:DUF5615 family PIN-like protein [Lewinella sp.]MCB9281657.1 DUF5615 family PIN-like protein [Lewinellaceae bacterium]